MSGDRILIDTNIFSIVAATALYFDLPLLTADKNFVKVTELNLMLYEK